MRRYSSLGRSNSATLFGSRRRNQNLEIATKDGPMHNSFTAFAQFIRAASQGFSPDADVAPSNWVNPARGPLTPRAFRRHREQAASNQQGSVGMLA